MASERHPRLPPDGHQDGRAAASFSAMHMVNHAADLAPYAGAALVPTMGALHDGHASLIRQARAHADGAAKNSMPVVVTIFVNPTQFAANEDLSRYPRTLDADLAIARAAGADAVFVPSVETIYPRGVDAAQREAAAWDLPPAATQPRLEDAFRPSHFGGVCLVVARLFELCRPQRAFFGEKDWQQWRVIAQMVDRERVRRERRFDDLELTPCATVRDVDGLAMSSRNRYLDTAARARATALWRSIGLARAVAPRSMASIAETERAMQRLLEEDGFSVDYAVIRDGASLLPPAAMIDCSSLRVLIAVRADGVRLIDNALLFADAAVSRGNSS